MWERKIKIQAMTQENADMLPHLLMKRYRYIVIVYQNDINSSDDKVQLVTY